MPHGNRETARLGQERSDLAADMNCCFLRINHGKGQIELKKIVQEMGVMWIRRKKTLALSCLASVLRTGIRLYQVPRFIAYSDRPAKSDAVILFAGENLDAGKKRIALCRVGQLKYLTAENISGARCTPPLEFSEAIQRAISNITLREGPVAAERSGESAAGKV